MNTTMRLTLDGLTRALRVRAHQMAEEIETGYVRSHQQRETGRHDGSHIGNSDDDVSGD